MNEKAFAAHLAALMNSECGDVDAAIPYDRLGVLTSNAGLLVRMSDGSEFQITVVRSRGPLD